MSNEATQKQTLQPTVPKQLNGLEDDKNTPPHDADPAAKQQKKPPAASPQSEFNLEDTMRVPFDPTDIPKSRMNQFICSAATELGLGNGHAWAACIFVTTALLSKSCFFYLGGRQRRLSLNMLLAGDDESGRARRLAIDILETLEIDVATNPQHFQLEKNLQKFSSDSTRITVGTSDENLFTRWQKKSAKEAISLAQLFNAELFNDFLKEEIRASILPPAAVPMLMACKLQDILANRQFPNSIFREALVIPCFGCSQKQLISKAKYNQLIENFIQQLPEIPTADIEITLNASAEKALKEYLSELSSSPLPLPLEGSAAHQRRAGAEEQAVVIAAATAFLNSSSKDETFTGKITKPDMEYAIEVVKMAHFRWKALNKIKEETRRRSQLDNVYYLTLSKYEKQHDDIHKGIRVKFTQLTALFCYHPDREGQFYSKELLTKVLPELEASGKVKRLSGPDKDVWIFLYNR